jgi:ribosomal protein S8E
VSIFLYGPRRKKSSTELQKNRDDGKSPWESKEKRKGKRGKEKKAHEVGEERKTNTKTRNVDQPEFLRAEIADVDMLKIIMMMMMTVLNAVLSLHACSLLSLRQ